MGSKVVETRRSRAKRVGPVVEGGMDGLELCELEVRRRRPGRPVHPPAGPPSFQESLHAPPEAFPPAQAVPAEAFAQPELPTAHDGLPGSPGEHQLQCALGTEERARRFYAEQMLDHLNPAMSEFVERMEMIFISTADGHGECDTSLRAGPVGFVQVLGAKQLAYPEYRGNGVLASLGNISENPHIGILMIDFVQDLIGLHVNGRARIVENAEMRAEYPGAQADQIKGRDPERWVVIEVQEAYIHCRKHIPRMVPVSRQRAWGTDDMRRKGGDYFGAKEQSAVRP